MALAILKPAGQKNGAFQFKIDIGTSNFYQYRIGEKKTKYRGIDQLELISYRSPIMTRNNITQKVVGSSFVLEIPQHHFNREKDKIQLVSFKKKNGTGIAMSDVVRVLPNLKRNESPLFPNFTLSLENKNMESTTVKHKPFIYRESKLSKPMFWGALIGAIPAIVKVAAPLVKKLFSKKKKPAASTGTPAPASSTKDDILNAIIDLLGNIKGNGAAAQPTTAKVAQHSLSATTTINPETLIELIPFLEKFISPETIQAIGDNPMKLFKAIGEAVLKVDGKDLEAYQYNKKGSSKNRVNGKKKEYAEAKFLSKLISAIPGIPPVVKAAIGAHPAISHHPLLGRMSPTQLILKSLLNGGGGGNGGNGIQYVNDDLGTDDSQLKNMLASLSIANGEVPPIKFKLFTNANLQFLNTNLVKLNGKSRLVYSKNTDLHFPIKISTDSPNAPQRAIPKVIVQAIFHDSDSDRFLFEKKFKLNNIRFNEEVNNIVITKEEASTLPANKDIKLELSFIWKGRQSRKNRGVFKIHYFSLANEYLFDRLGETSEAPIPLNDVVQYRPFWHKIWEGGFSKSNRWEIDLDVKYYYALDLEEDVISKLETKRRIENDNVGSDEHLRIRQVEGKIKSGLEVSLPVLNNLLTSLSKPLLNENQLEALYTEDLKKYYNQVARTSVEIRGRSGDTAAVWTYPEITIHKVHLVRPENINELGQVTEFIEEVVEFPRPSIIHFIATRSE